MKEKKKKPLSMFKRVTKTFAEMQTMNREHEEVCPYCKGTGRRRYTMDGFGKIIPRIG